MTDNFKYNLIFSSTFSWRLGRHLMFWITRILMCFIIGIPFVHSVELLDLYSLSNLFYNYFHDVVLFDIPFTYVVCYLFIPTLVLKEKYTQFYYTFIIWFVLYSTAFVITEFLHTRSLEIANKEDLTPFNAFFIFWKMKVFLTYTMVSFILFTTIKLYKVWYLKEKENQLLIKLNNEIKLEVLQSKIHPHFLFNSLNTIYSFTLFDRSKTKGMLERLYNILHYMIYDCNTEYISVLKEINTLLDYINLEKERYGDRLRLNIHQSGEFNKAQIAPLLLQPFVENAFKHGVAKTVSPSSIDIAIEAIDGSLYFTISNSISKTNKFQSKIGIGIENIKSRLNILYPDTHVLEINQTEELFKVKLVVPLKPS